MLNRSSIFNAKSNSDQTAVPQAELVVRALIASELLLLGVINCGPLGQEVKMLPAQARELVYWLETYASNDLKYQQSLSDRLAKGDAIYTEYASGVPPEVAIALEGSKEPLMVVAGASTAATLLFPVQAGGLRLSYHLNTLGAQSLADTFRKALETLEPFETAFLRTNLPRHARHPPALTRN